MKRFLLALGLCTLLMAEAGAQIHKTKFNAQNATAHLRVEYGIYLQTHSETWDAPLLGISYTRQFWGPFSYRAGIQHIGETPAYSSQLGFPLGLAYCPGTRPMGSSLIGAAEASVFDVVRDGYYGREDTIWSDIFFNFVAALFRRTEYFVSLTPAWYGGHYTESLYQRDQRFSLTGDVGLVLSIPIRRLSINVSPTYHYAFTRNMTYGDQTPRSFFSFTGGIGLFF